MSVMISIVIGILASLVSPYVVRAIGRSTPSMHRILINSMRERLGEEVVRFYQIHGHGPYEPDDDPSDHPEDQETR